MPKLNQILAVEKGAKARAYRAVTDLYHQLQKTPLLSGISRSYQPKEDDGETLPPESTKVQVKAATVLTNVADHMTNLFDIVATKDNANCGARGDVVVDGQTLLRDVPVTTLLFLEKQLGDFESIVKKLPTLDPAANWRYDTAQDCYATEPVQTTRSKKIPRNHVKAVATDKHPAQVELWLEDITVGYWTTVKYSGALPTATVTDLSRRLNKLRDAVKVAREEANSIEAPNVQVGEACFGYLLADLDADPRAAG